MQLVFDFPINPRYTFDNFVVCGGNGAAYRFARLLAAGEEQNLLYIYGPAGSGKTHLLMALGKSFYDTIHLPQAIPYVSFKEIDELYRGEYRAEQASKLAERFSNAPILLVDDLHLIPDTPYLRQELWQLFNDFHGAGKKIAITGLHPPKELPHLDDHLVSRLLWGLVAKVDVSDDASRRLILQKLAADRQVVLPDDAIDYLLAHTARDIESLIGALEEINRHALATGRKISARLAREALESRGAAG